jgi:hypothetical protein
MDSAPKMGHFLTGNEFDETAIQDIHIIAITFTDPDAVVRIEELLRCGCEQKQS